MTVRVGIVGTSWWSDAMYLPALQKHPQAEVVAAAGRNAQRTQDFAQRWKIPNAFTDWRAMLDTGGIDALIVASANDSHYPISMAALDAGLHVLCEKPVANSAAQAREMNAKAQAAGLKTMVPFTYRYMPTARYIKQLLDADYIGRPYHLNMRYYTGYGREGKYDWRFDKEIAGAGVVGDLGSHWLYLARWYFGEITAIACVAEILLNRPKRPDGSDYTRAEDSAFMTVKFANGAFGSLQVTTLAWEGTDFGQTHHMEFHGADGTLYHVIDWDSVQEIKGLKAGETGGAKPIAVPEAVWGSARRDTVHNTYRDVFREENHMTREFINAIDAGQPVDGPTLADGARVQELVEAALKSAQEGGRLLAV